jgi:hypothetical protein
LPTPPPPPPTKLEIDKQCVLYMYSIQYICPDINGVCIMGVACPTLHTVYTLVNKVSEISGAYN